MSSTALVRPTWHDLVRQELGRWVPDGFAGYVLWNETAFPFAKEEHIRKQVREYRDGRRFNDDGSETWRA